MDITPLALAAGLLEFPVVWESDANTITESHAKGSRYNGSIYYFPFHKLRSMYYVQPYPQESYVAVERRSLPLFKQGSFAFETGPFPRLVKEVTFSYLAGWGIRAVQTEPEKRDEEDNNLAHLWENAMARWNGLLRTHGLQNPSNEERYRVIDKEDPLTDTVLLPSEEKGQTEYESFIGKVAPLAQRNETFREEAKAIIRDYSREARKIIRY